MKVTVEGCANPVSIDKVTELFILVRQANGNKKLAVHCNEDFLAFTARIADKRITDMLKDMEPMLIKEVETE